MKVFSGEARGRISKAVVQVEKRPLLEIATAGLRRRGVGGQSHWGKTDAQVTAGNSVAVSVWEGDPLADSGENVTATVKPTLGTITIPITTFVRIEKIDGRWWITDFLQEVYTKEPLTDFEVDGTNKKIHVKTQSISFVAQTKGTESGWTKEHTGDVCP